MPSVSAIIMARMGSSRFPGKVMADLNGKPLLQHVIERAKKSKYLNKIIVATTKTLNNENLPIVELCSKLQVACSYESGSSALEEFMLAARKSQSEILVRITADAALLSVEALDRMIEFLIKNNADYTHNRHRQGVPLGMHAEVISLSAMEKVFEKAIEKKHKNHITLYILENHNLFKIANFEEDKEIQRPNVILTIDRPEELEKVQKIIQELGDKSYNLREVVKYLDSHPEYSEKEIDYHMDFMYLLHHNIQMAETIKIGNRIIGLGQPVFTIAEVGVDHKGNMDEAKRLIDEAKKAGADAIKFQTYYADRLVTPDARCYWHLIPADNPSVRQIDTFGNLDKLRRDIYKELIDYGKNRDIVVFSTPFDEEAVDVLADAGVEAIKIASGDLTCHPLLKKAAEKKIPILLSTGASTYEEIDEALKVIRDNGNPPVALMHCILDYPTQDKDANLRAIQGYIKRYNIPVGFSDHTLTVPPGALAVYHGASFLEKHCTGEKFESQEGKPLNPDASFMSMDEFAEYVSEIRKMERGEIKINDLKKWAGDYIELLSGVEGPHRPLNCEFSAFREARRSLVSTRDIKKGESILLKDLTWKRPATGIRPSLKNIAYVVGRKAMTDIKENTVIAHHMIDNS